MKRLNQDLEAEVVCNKLKVCFVFFCYLLENTRTCSCNCCNVFILIMTQASSSYVLNHGASKKCYSWTLYSVLF